MHRKGKYLTVAKFVAVGCLVAFGVNEYFLYHFREDAKRQHHLEDPKVTGDGEIYYCAKRYIFSPTTLRQITMLSLHTMLISSLSYP
jgi:hypothetical protein